MKNIFKLFFLIVVNSYSQQNFENANWVFGFGNILTIPTATSTLLPLSSSAFIGAEGVASVSDRNGNLLLYTDGIRLWYRNLNGDDIILTDSLLGTPSSAQNAIFIPKPKHPNRYYLVTINGFSTGIINKSGVVVQIEPERRGLHYSEIEIVCGQANIVPNRLNIPLRDNVGDVIDVTYNNLSEAITSTRHNDSVNYWLVAHIQKSLVGGSEFGNIFSYIVSEDGIGISNGSQDNLPSSTTPYTPGPQPNNFYRRVLYMKISPNSERIAIQTNNGYGIKIGSFINSNGLVSITNSITDVAVGIEFSNDSNILYYASGNFIKKIQLEPLNLTNIITDNSISPRALQLGLDNKIYISNNNNSSLDFISSTNDFAESDFVDGSVSILENATFGLPQLVNFQPCGDFLVDNQDLLSNNFGQIIVERSNYIVQTNKIVNDARAIYHAGNFIELLPTDNCDGNGFEAEYGSEFVAYIEGCTNNFVYKNGNIVNQSFEEKGKYDFLEKEVKELSIVPNPSSNSIEILIKNSTFNKVIITSTDGKIVLDKNFDNSESFQVDVSNYANGLYIVNVIDKDGQIYNQKLIKN